MTPYRRPHIPPRKYFTPEGTPIHYGERWAGLDGPPEDTYSVTHNPGRFAPLHDIADALIQWLDQNFQATAEEDTAFASDLLHPTEDVQRSIRITPTEPGSAPLTFVLTSVPSVLIHAGLLVDLRFPSCGCDACDETWESAAEDMEWHVHRVVFGEFTERVSRRITGTEFHSGFSDADGCRRSMTQARGYPQVRLNAARKLLAGGHSWDPWPLVEEGTA